MSPRRDRREVNELQRIGERVRSIREERGMSMREVARRAKLAPYTLSKIESGQASPAVATLEQIADAFGMTMSELVGGAREDGGLTEFERLLVEAARRAPQDRRERAMVLLMEPLFGPRMTGAAQIA